MDIGKLFRRGKPALPEAPGAADASLSAAGPSGRIPLWGAEITAESLSFWRQSLRTAQQAVLVLASLTAVCLTALLVSLLCRPDPVYFGMSRDMKLLPMTPLSEPVLSEAALKNWAAEAVTTAFNLDFLRWRSQLAGARVFFTRRAFARFALSLDREGHLPLLRQQRALMHAVIQGTPLITRTGVVRGTLVWEAEIPLLLSWENSAGRLAASPLTVVCRIQRVPAAEYPRGVALASLVTTRRSPGR